MKGIQIAAVGGGAALVIIALSLTLGQPQDDMMPTQIQTEVAPAEEKFLVYTTFYPLQQFAQNIAGDAADVKLLIPANADPHAFELGPKTIADLASADMLVYNGVDFEPYIDEIKSSPDFEHLVLVDSSEGITFLEGEAHHHGHEGHDDEREGHAEEFLGEIAHTIEEFEHGHMTEFEAIASIEEILREHEGDGHEHGEGMIEAIEAILHEVEDGHIGGPEGLEKIHQLVSRDGEPGLDHVYDPHVWLDPLLAKKQVTNIALHMAEADPANSETYNRNAESYSDQLDALDQEIRAQLSSCKRDTFVPFHNAFSYFAERYDLHTLAVIQEFGAETPVTAKDIEKLIHFAEENDVKYFFTEENKNPKIAESLASELGGDILLFSPLESLSAEDHPDVTYFEKMRANLDNLKIALDC